MKVIEVPDYKNLCKRAAEIIIDRVQSARSINLGVATGATMLGVYKQLVKDFTENGTSYRHVYTFNLDEYVGLGSEHPNSYHYYMNKNFFRFLDIPKNHIYIPDGKAENLEEECLEYESNVQKMGGIDLQLLGIGGNGHIGFNEPGTSFQSRTHVVQLAKSTRMANARYFRDLSEVPTRAITMGIATIMESKQIVLLASGVEKAEVLNRLIHGEIDESIPASVLKRHADVTIIADSEALKVTKEGEGLILYDQ